MNVNVTTASIFVPNFARLPSLRSGDSGQVILS